MSSKLREALTKVSDVLETWCDHLPPIIQDKAKEALALADEALAEPPRNCDLVKNFYDAQKRFLRETGELVIRDEIYDWLFAKAKGGVNESV